MMISCFPSPSKSASATPRQGAKMPEDTDTGQPGIIARSAGPDAGSGSDEARTVVMPGAEDSGPLTDISSRPAWDRAAAVRSRTMKRIATSLGSVLQLSVADSIPGTRPVKRSGGPGPR